ncbi:MAG: bifunctional riboflavin kinase/FAD synthetase [Sphingomonadales bacterium]|nr:bifunctional riboflavin kinase/FAD synthetase [Sphingomonadales bacterium]
MKRPYHNPSEIPSDQPLVITQGTFDGVHLGHQKVLKQVVALAKSKNTKSLLITYHPHPRLVIDPSNHELRMLSSIEEKAQAVYDLGVDYVLVLPFTQEFAQLSPRDFVKTILVDQLHVDTIVIGYDHRFGKNREGDFQSLMALAQEFHFQVQEIPASEIDAIAISSTRIRKALSNKQLNEANTLLGKPYILTGIVREGQKLGRTIGFPTANLDIQDPYKLIPPSGVYAGYCLLENERYKMVCNIGYRPTVNGQDLRVEAHLFEFDKNIYGRPISLFLVQYLRNEQKFDSLESLKTQILIDAQQAQSMVQFD